MIRRPPRSTRTDTLFPYTTLFRSQEASVLLDCATHCQSRPSLPTFSGVLGRRENSPDQTRIAPVEPYRPVISFWSLPTQTTARWRSEEHTSELQSLMRSSYAVFCLKKKTRKM